tara:strand:+ start:256 stop:636 length:381 start_codon:yes stop_codon:yes gene_type:complete
MDLDFSSTYHDSRGYTNYQPRCVTNSQLQKLANTNDSSEVRRFLTKNGKKLIDNSVVIDDKKCFTCNYDDRIKFYKKHEIQMLEDDIKIQNNLEKVRVKGTLESKRLKSIGGIPGVFAEVLYLAKQ